MDTGVAMEGNTSAKYYKNIYAKLDFVEEFYIHKHLHEISKKNDPVTDTLNEYLCDEFYGKLDKAIRRKDELNIGTLGYFQSECHIDGYQKEIRELFTPSIGLIPYLEANTDIFSRFPELKEEHDYAFIGVRRGHYIIKEAAFHNPCGMIYYKKAMRQMNKQRYYILSDDFNWVKKYFKGDAYRYLELDDDIHRMLVQGLFKNYILSNSSFYWWGSFLSIYEHPRILVPNKWMGEEWEHETEPDRYCGIYRPCMEIIERPYEYFYS
jgi:hypothetical protein